MKCVKSQFDWTQLALIPSLQPVFLLFIVDNDDVDGGGQQGRWVWGRGGLQDAETETDKAVQEFVFEEVTVGTAGAVAEEQASEDVGGVGGEGRISTSRKGEVMGAAWRHASLPPLLGLVSLSCQMKSCN